ncbi:MAG: S8 family serine peptidase [Planctomycetota bacterium]
MERTRRLTAPALCALATAAAVSVGVGRRSAEPALEVRTTAAPSLEAGSSAPAPAARAGFVVQAPLAALAEVAREHGLRCARTIPALEAALLEGPAARAEELLRALRADPRVRAASPNHAFEVAGASCCDGGHAARPGALADGLRRAHERVARVLGALHGKSTGAGVRVAVLDTGCDGAHRDLPVVEGASVDPALPWDRDPAGHGTAMAALVAGHPRAGEDGLWGVAPDAALIAIRVGDDAGRSTLAEVAAGLVLAVDRGAQVVLLALGAPQSAPVLEDALAYAEQRGALVIAAAGNANVHQDLYPAALPSALSVACVDDQGRLAWSTALAPTTDLLAPGVEVATALPVAAGQGGYGFVTGSSAAAAHVAGVAALLLERRADLSPAALRALLRMSARPLPVFAGDAALVRAFPAGVLDPEALNAALEAASGRVEPRDLRAWPAAARPGEALAIAARLVNPSPAASAATRVVCSLGGAPLAEETVTLAPGEERELRLRATLPAGFLGGELVLNAGVDAAARWPLALASAPSRDLGFVSARAEAAPEGGLELVATLEGRGAAPEGAVVRATLATKRGELVLSEEPVPPLAAGEQRELRVRATSAQVLAQGRCFQARFELVGRGPDDAPRDDRALLDLRSPVAAPRPVETQYQQSGGLNLVADAPYRVEPSRPYLPLLLFVAEKGDVDPSTWLELGKVSVYQRSAPDSAAGPGALVYQDELQGSVTAPSGLVILDELGQPLRQGGAPDLRLFQHARIDQPGRYAILRLPRASLGVAPIPTAAEDRYLDVRYEWSNNRVFLFGSAKLQQGTTRWVLRTTFGAAPRPSLPGGGGYFDAHVHTIAEWCQEDGFDLLAPRRNLGGPLPMVMETAYAIGLTDAVDAVNGRVITTDHNAFMNAGDTLRDRPPLGTSSLLASGGRSEFERYREVFGATSSEEVTFQAINSFLTVPVLGSISMPTGAHMLTYRAEHIQGAWHGGSTLAAALGEKQPTVELTGLLRQLTTQNRAANHGAATYAAHPYSGTVGWEPKHFDIAFEYDLARRTDLPVHMEQTGFVTKGLQLWNGDGGRHELATSKVDWSDLNPWADPDWQRGSDDWDGRVWSNLIRYHQDHVERLLRYELKARPGVRFPRKILGVAGTDAHGDFNFETSRQATILDLQSTYDVGYRAFGRVATYVFPEGAQGATPAERAYQAFLDGRSCLSDGPLLHVSLDAEDRFDGAALRWHDKTRSAEDRDGRVGGGGAFDGEGTALVARGSDHLRYGYRYTTNQDLGAITHVAIYRTSPGDPNPTTKRASGLELLQARGWLAPTGPDQDLEQALDPAAEGPIDQVSALQFAAFTADPVATKVEDHRCYTNPLYAAPYDVSVDVARTETDAQGKGSIPAGALTVTFRFDVSLQAMPTGVELKALDTQGDSSDKATGPIDVLEGVGALNGWSDAPNGTKSSVLTLTNRRPIPLDLDRYPAAGRVSFVVYTYEPLQDAFGNALNPIAHVFDVKGIGTGGGTGPALARQTATTAPGATQSPQPVLSGGGGGGGGGCGLGDTPTGGRLPLALLLLALLALRRRSGLG